MRSALWIIVSNFATENTSRNFWPYGHLRGMTSKRRLALTVATLNGVFLISNRARRRADLYVTFTAQYTCWPAQSTSPKAPPSAPLSPEFPTLVPPGYPRGHSCCTTEKTRWKRLKYDSNQVTRRSTTPHILCNEMLEITILYFRSKHETLTQCGLNIGPPS